MKRNRFSLIPEDFLKTRGEGVRSFALTVHLVIPSVTMYCSPEFEGLHSVGRVKWISLFCAEGHVAFKGLPRESCSEPDLAPQRVQFQEVTFSRGPATTREVPDPDELPAQPRGVNTCQMASLQGKGLFCRERTQTLLPGGTGSWDPSSPQQVLPTAGPKGNYTACEAQPPSPANADTCFHRAKEKM